MRLLSGIKGCWTEGGCCLSRGKGCQKFEGRVGRDVEGGSTYIDDSADKKAFSLIGFDFQFILGTSPRGWRDLTEPY